MTATEDLWRLEPNPHCGHVTGSWEFVVEHTDFTRMSPNRTLDQYHFRRVVLDFSFWTLLKVGGAVDRPKDVVVSVRNISEPRRRRLYLRSLELYTNNWLVLPPHVQRDPAFVEEALRVNPAISHFLPTATQQQPEE